LLQEQIIRVFERSKFLISLYFSKGTNQRRE
jgi:hypothetical protein